MNTKNTTHDPNADWQNLGELELPVSTGADEALSTWLTKTLHPLNLQTELLNKIMVSAQDAIARAIHAEIVLKFEHIHLKIFVPSKRKEKEQAWGFFRLEKIEDTKENLTDGDHAVEFYLYGD